MGLPHSKTLARFLACYSIREVVECSGPLPLLPQAKQEQIFPEYEPFRFTHLLLLRP